MKTITIDVINKTAVAEVVEGDVGVKVTIKNTPQEWENCTVFALITQDSASQHIKVINNKFDVPPAFTDANKAFKIGVYAVGADGSRDVRPSIWIRVENSDFTTDDIEITQQNIDDILMLQAQCTEYAKAEEARAKAEEVRQTNESERKEAERNRKTELIDIKRRLSDAETDIDNLEDGKVDKIDGMGLSQNSYTDYDYNKLAMIEHGAQVNEPVDQTYQNKSSNAQSGKAVAQAIAQLVGSAPETLDTIEEVAKALGDDPNFATTVMNEVGKKVDKINGYGLVNVDFRFSLNNQEDSIILNINNYGGSPEQIEFFSKETSKRLFLNKVDRIPEYGVAKLSGNKSYSTIWVVDSESLTESAVNVYDTTQITAFLDSKAEKTKVSNQIPDDDIPVPNTEYILGIILDLAIRLPITANKGDVVYINFISGEDPTTLTIDTTRAYGFELIPEPKKAYEIYGKYDGRKWMLGYAEFNVSDDDLI